MTNAELNTPWSVEAIDLASLLETDLQTGLTADAVAIRREEFGPNRLAEAKRVSPLALFARQFLDLMVGLLIAAAIISGLVGDWTDTVLIVLIVIANAVIGFVQEYRAEQAVAALQGMSQQFARVHRDGHLHEIPSEDLVPGDVIEVLAGDVVSADCRIVTAAALEVNESALTGESLAIEKSPTPIGPAAVLADRSSMLYSGTAIARGRATALVLATGPRTEIGRIAHLLEVSESGPTPLQRRLAELNRSLAILVIVVSMITFAIGVLREPISQWTRNLYVEMLLVAVSLAVAAIPEGLPAVITITLALGSHRMARRRAIIRRLSAVEGLGSVDVICSDKTGTLTQNRMQVDKLLPSGEHTPDDVLKLMILCSDAEFDQETRETIGSPTEKAIIQAAVAHNLDITAIRAAQPRISETPFSSERKRMTTIHQAGDGNRLMVVKGAPDRLIDLCRFDNAHERELAQQKVADLAESGRRTLAVATRSLDQSEPEDLTEQDLELIGIVAIVDPVRPEVKESIQICKQAGIRPVMITGDHPGTARSIADELGLLEPGDRILTGQELEAIGDEELQQVVLQTGIFARVSPEHKLRIVNSLQALGRTVAMTGDGVNDAPALKQADIGVAMGITGTDVSKEAADMILADDNFHTIVSAVEEGRIVYDNIRKFVAYLLTANASEILVIVGAMLLGFPLPLLPVHLLWINLVTDGLPALALGFEPGEHNVMQRAPRKRETGLFGNGLDRGIVIMGCIMACISLWLFSSFLPGEDPQGTASLEKARSVTFLTLAVSQLFYVCAIRSFSESFWQFGFWSNYRLTGAVIIGIALQLMTLYVPMMQSLFKTVPLSGQELTIAMLCSLIPFAVVETWKLVHHPKSKNSTK